jgi:glyoxylase-like metal-dependent hydrolase (beta-lactamase superfamily II)
VRDRLVTPLLAGLVLLASATVGAQTSTQVAVEKMTEGVWAAVTPFGSNVGWFDVGDGVVVVDTGSDAATARAILGEIAKTANKPVRRVVLTHDHADHTGGMRVFAQAGAEIVAQEKGAGTDLYLLHSAPETEATGPKPTRMQGLLSFSERILVVGGPRRYELYFLGDAHTNNDVVVYLPDDKVLFTGDVVNYKRLPFLRSTTCDPESWQKVAERLSALSVDFLVPGHGDPGPEAKAGIADTVVYLRRVNEIAQKFIEQKVTEDLFPYRLRDPENRIENVPVNDDHVANVTAAWKWRQAKHAGESKPTPAAGGGPPRRTPTPKG